MRSCVKHLSHFLIYGALILALTTFYAIDRVNASSFNTRPTSMSLTLPRDGYDWPISSSQITTIGVGGMTLYGYVFSFDQNHPVSKFNAIYNVPSEYQNKDVKINGYAFINRGSITNVRAFGMNCKFEYTYRNDNGKIEAHGNGSLVSFTCEGKLSTNRVDIIREYDTSTYSSTSVGINIDDINFTTNQAIQDTNNLINDSTIDESEVGGVIGQLQNMFGVDTNIITQLFVIPFNIINTIYTPTGHECTTYDFGEWFGYHLKFGCVNLRDIIGVELYNIIDVVFAGIISLGFINHLKNLINDMITLSDKFGQRSNIQILR